jgi:peroxisomal coenzyme A diphosphatase NUDT7
MDEILNKLFTSLPKEPGILGRRKYFNTAVFVPFIMIEERPHLVFQKRAKGIRQENEISFPGGGFDPEIDKNFSETAVRETSEELGIKKEEISICGRLDTMVAPMGALIEIFVGVINSAGIDKFKINKKEVESVFTLPLSFFLENKPESFKVRLEIQSVKKNPDGTKEILLPAKELGLPEKYYESWGGKLHEIYLYKTDYGAIWGITAEIIKELVHIYTGETNEK